jgi:hypothetical protein
LRVWVVRANGLSLYPLCSFRAPLIATNLGTDSKKVT